MPFDNFIRILDGWGVADVLLPFILVFTIVFAVMQKAKIFGEGKKNFNVMVSLVFGLAIVFPHVLGMEPDVVPIINSSLPGVGIVLVAIMSLLLLIGIMGGEVKWLGSSISGWIAIIALIIIIYIFGGAANWWTGRWPNWLNFMNSSDAQAFIVILLVFGIIVWYITKDDAGDAKKGKFFSDMTEGIGKLFGGK